MQTARITARPELLGDVVIAGRSNEVAAYDVATGRALWMVPTEGQTYLGATRDDDAVVLVFGGGRPGRARMRSSVVAVSARSGDEQWRHDVDGALGRPAAYNGHVLVPWDWQKVVVLDASNGNEVLRLRLREDLVSWVDADDSAVFLGSRGAYWLTADPRTLTKNEGVYLAPPSPAFIEMLGKISTHEDAYQPIPATRSAYGRVRFYVSPEVDAATRRLGLVGETAYLVHYRYVFAFDARNGLRWARVLDRDLVAAEITSSGLLVAEENGHVSLFDASSGTPKLETNLGVGVSSASLQVGDGAGASTSDEVPDVRTSLRNIVADPDNRLVRARAFAVRWLASIDTPEATRDLIELHAQPSMPSELREEIGRALQTRRTGLDYLIAGLSQHYDFLAGTAAPPLEVIVPAVLEARAREAVPALLTQLQDHETPLDALPIVLRALVELGDASIVPALRDFTKVYHADSTFSVRTESLAIAAEGLLRHGGANERTLLAELQQDARTLPSLVRVLAAMMDTNAERSDTRVAAVNEAITPSETAALSSHLTQEQIRAAFAPQSDALIACIEQATERIPELAQVRMVFLIDGSGAGKTFTFAPDDPELVGCLQPVVAEVHFPAFAARMQSASFSVSIRNTLAAPEPSSPGADDTRWWRFQEERASDVRTGPLPAPWWIPHQATIAPIAPVEPEEDRWWEPVE